MNFLYFVDLLGENAGGQGAALGFQYYGNGPIVTVLASKTSRKHFLMSLSIMSELILLLGFKFLKAKLNLQDYINKETKLIIWESILG